MQPANWTARWRENRILALLAGPLAAGLILLLDLQPGTPAVTRMAAIAVWMAIWWITEAVPLAVTSLLPVVLFPLLQVMAGKDTAPLYFNSTIFLFIGGFLIALAMQRWNLHKRIALLIIRAIGVSPSRLLLGFLVATAFISMWISNTATAMMMLPIAMAVVLKLKEVGDQQDGLATGLVLSIAYASSIGGIATLVGTPPNLSFVRIFGISFEQAPKIAFTQWMFFALPVSVAMLLFTWLYLTFVFARKKGAAGFDRSVFTEELRQLGPLSREELLVLIVFCATAVLWLTGADLALGSFTFKGWASRLGLSAFVDDGTVAIGMAILLFLLPASNGGGRLMRWEDAAKLPWGIVLLFGGGFALASGFKTSGLSGWCGEQLAGLAGLHPIVIVAIVCTLLTFLTELTSNTATTEMVLPILAATAVSLKLNPLLLMIPATISASFAFMLPVGTPPNAIVFGSGYVTIPQMAKAGLALNFAGIVIVTVLMMTLGCAVFGIDANSMPAWALAK